MQERVGRMAQLQDDPSGTNGTAHASAPIHGSLGAPWHRGETLFRALLREVFKAFRAEATGKMLRPG